MAKRTYTDAPTLTKKQREYIRTTYHYRGKGKHNTKAIAKHLGISKDSVLRVCRGLRYNIKRPLMSEELLQTIDTAKMTFKPLEEMLKRPHSNECDYGCPVCGMGVHGTFPRKAMYGKPFRNIAEANRCCQR